MSLKKVIRVTLTQDFCIDKNVAAVHGHHNTLWLCLESSTTTFLYRGHYLASEWTKWQTSRCISTVTYNIIIEYEYFFHHIHTYVVVLSSSSSSLKLQSSITKQTPIIGSSHNGPAKDANWNPLTKLLSYL
jgi:hypothetical protein